MRYMTGYLTGGIRSRTINVHAQTLTALLVALAAIQMASSAPIPILTSTQSEPRTLNTVNVPEIAPRKNQPMSRIDVRRLTKTSVSSASSSSPLDTAISSRSDDSPLCTPCIEMTTNQDNRNIATHVASSSWTDYPGAAESILLGSLQGFCKSLASAQQVNDCNEVLNLHGNTIVGDLLDNIAGASICSLEGVALCSAQAIAAKEARNVALDEFEDPRTRKIEREADEGVVLIGWQRVVDDALEERTQGWTWTNVAGRLRYGRDSMGL